jgi:short-subunit dehydrogenase
MSPAPDILVNNAGVGHVGTADSLSDAELDTLVAVNLRAPLALTRAVLPAMLARRSGHLVFVTSIAGLLGVARESGYAAVKAALQVYADSLRTEVVSSGVGVTTVVPGVVDTAFFDRRGAAYARRFPRLISADTVAAALVRGIERNRAEVIVPRWLRVPVAIRALAPSLYARLSTGRTSS